MRPTRPASDRTGPDSKQTLSNQAKTGLAKPTATEHDPAPNENRVASASRTGDHRTDPGHGHDGCGSWAMRRANRHPPDRTQPRTQRVWRDDRRNQQTATRRTNPPMMTTGAAWRPKAVQSAVLWLLAVGCGRRPQFPFVPIRSHPCVRGCGSRVAEGDRAATRAKRAPLRRTPERRTLANRAEGIGAKTRKPKQPGSATRGLRPMQPKQPTRHAQNSKSSPQSRIIPTHPMRPRPRRSSSRTKIMPSNPDIIG